jgi:hypothetical protein
LQTYKHSVGTPVEQSAGANAFLALVAQAVFQFEKQAFQMSI